ncbi:MAG: ABC transporter permease, partial [Deltaproteobacteria bacterium]|nr:ABC transporter permease [Deltaproteobacteria bacterium]
STQSLVKDVDLVVRIWFPREILPIASILASLFDFLLALLFFVGMIYVYGHSLSWTAIALVPLLVVQLILVVGLALFNSAVNVRYRDIKYIVPLGIQLWMFVSPVIYSLAEVPEHLRGLYLLNPVAGLVDGYRTALIHHQLPDWTNVGTSAGVSVAILLFGWWYFRRVEITFADVI